MKQIFDWLREQMQIKSDIIHHNWEETNDEKQFKCHTAYDDTIRMVDEAEAKWEAECCEWKLYKYHKNRWIADCDESVCTTNTTECFNYCPYCGKPIKISEVE